MGIDIQLGSDVIDSDKYFSAVCQNIFKLNLVE